MAYWVVRARDAYTIHEAESWLDVLPAGLHELGIDVPRVRVASGADGAIVVAEPSGRVVAYLHEGTAPQQAADGQLDTEPPVSDGMVALLDEPLPTTEAPLPSDIAERLFEVSAPIDEAGSDAEAAQVAVDLLISVVPADSASVITAGIDQARFEFLAAGGPKADAVRNITLPLGKGHVGAVHDSGVAMLVHDVAHSARHWHAVDEETGFRPHSLVAVPIRSSDGRSWGVIELLADDDRFFGWHVTAAETVATTLAERLAASSPA